MICSAFWIRLMQLSISPGTLLTVLTIFIPMFVLLDCHSNHTDVLLTTKTISTNRLISIIDPSNSSLPSNSVQSNKLIHRSSRNKRGIIQLASMIKCVSGCEPFQYKGYGCFCGLFGSGKPVDPIDRCCLKHDHCYSVAPCHQLLTYLMPYSWDCMAPGYAHCALTDYHRSKDKCGYSLCECDRIFAECISQYPCPSSKAKCPYRSMVLTVYGK